MTKEEQLKIYSAYLPYQLKINDPKCPIERELTHKGYWHRSSEDDTVFVSVDEVIDTNLKPILYDLSYLTKEIEHEGENTIILSEYIYNNWFIKIRVDGHFTLDNGDATVTGFTYKSAPYDLIQLLLKFHFNVFGLREGEYINKATLKP